MKPETIISSEQVFNGAIFNVETRQVQLANGQMVRRDVLVNNGAVVVIALTADNQIRLLRQFRAGVDKWVYELPAGGLKPDEDPDVAAPRELLEETGDRAATWRKLHGFYSAPGILSEFLHFYLATDLTPGPSELEFDEHIEVLTLPWSEVISMVKRGEIEDAKTIAGLLVAGLHVGLITT